MNKKRLLAIILSLVMLLAVTATATLAEDPMNDPFGVDNWGVTTVPSETTTTSSVAVQDTTTTTTTTSSVDIQDTTTTTTTTSSVDIQDTTTTTTTSSVPIQGTTTTTTTTTTTGPIQNTTSALDPSNPDNEPIPDDIQDLTVSVKNASGTTISKTNKFFVGNLKNGNKEYAFSYVLSNPNAKVVWESTDKTKLQVVSDNGKQVKVKIVCINPAKNFTNYVAVNCKYKDEVVFTLNITYIQLNNVKNVKTVGNKLSWGDVEYAKGYVVYDLTTKKEKVVRKTTFKATPGHSYQVQAFEESLGVKYYSTKSAKAFSLKAPKAKLTAGKKLIKVTAKKVKNADKFQVKYKLGKGKWITKTFKTKKALNTKIKKLKSGKVYKVQVRVCKNKNSFSSWTKVKNINVK